MDSLAHAPPSRAAGSSSTAERCPGCGLTGAVAAGSTHPYYGASSACWVSYGRVLARAYSTPACRDVLQLVVDAYACQHPGSPGRRQTQSVGIHLMTLAMVLEDGADPREGPQLHRRMVARPVFTWLEPPLDLRPVTVADLADASTDEEHRERSWAWARAVWAAWSAHHGTVRAWVELSLR